MDDQRRVAMVETKTPASGPSTTVSRYQYDNHLQTALIELDATGALISYEEFHPYGTTAWWAQSSTIQVSRKRYRYTGMERDEETGLQYHHHRYYAPWLGRWTSADPIGITSTGGLHQYTGNNPARFSDQRGLLEEDAADRIAATLRSIKSWQKADSSVKSADGENLTQYEVEVASVAAKTKYAPNVPGAYEVSSEEAVDAYRASERLNMVIRPGVLLALAQVEGMASPRGFARHYLSGNPYQIRATSAEEAKAIFRSQLLYEGFGLDRATYHAPRKGGVGDNPRPSLDEGSGTFHDSNFNSAILEAVERGLLPRNWLSTVNSQIEVTQIGDGNYSVVARDGLRETLLTTVGAVFHQDLVNAYNATGGGSDTLSIAYVSWNRPDKGREWFFNANPEQVKSTANWAFRSYVPSEGHSQWSNLRRPALTISVLSAAYERMYSASGL
jgi:RHS repeat-associated protein